MIEEIAIKGGERIDTLQIRAASGLHVGQRWDTSATGRALRALTSLVGVRDVKIESERLARNRVRVHIIVEEREPYGIISLDEGGLFWVDREGYLLGQLEGKPALPVMVGVRLLATPRGERVEGEQAQRVIEEFFALDGRVLSLFTELRLRKYDVELQAHEGWRLRLLPQDLSRHLRRLDAIRSALGKVDWRLLDLRFAGEVVLGR